MSHKTKALLTVAGFDGTGGAGLLIDTKICSFFSIQSISVIASLVIQSPFEVKKKVDIDLNLIKEQIKTLDDFYSINTINIGVFGKVETLHYILEKFRGKKIILDPIFFSGSGKFEFLKKGGIKRLEGLLKAVYLITPNIQEAELLTGEKIQTPQDMRNAAGMIKKKYGINNILVKGGHLVDERDNNRSVDLLFHQDRFYEFKSTLKPFRIHGTGSFLNAAIAACIFKGESLITSIETAKQMLSSSAENVIPGNPILMPVYPESGFTP